MSKISLSIIVLILAGLLVGAVVLANWDIPAPSTSIEKVLPDAQFPR